MVIATLPPRMQKFTLFINRPPLEIMDTAFITALYRKSLEKISVTLLPPSIEKKSTSAPPFEGLNLLFSFIFYVFSHKLVKI